MCVGYVHGFNFRLLMELSQGCQAQKDFVKPMRRGYKRASTSADGARKLRNMLK